MHKYDGAQNLQGHISGVQALVCSQHFHFAIPNHCFNHQLQLSVKKGVKGHALMENTISYCEIVVKLFKYSPKRATMLQNIKIELRDTLTASQFTSSVGKVLGIYITRWTCRADSLMRIFTSYFAIVKGFLI